MRVLDLFSGIGGFSLGLESTGGFEPAAFCEINERAAAVLRKHWPRARQFRDVRSIDAAGVAGLGCIHAVTAGFPCQDISLAGNAAGLSGSRSGLFWEVVRIVRLARPAIVLLENVAALLARGMDAVLGALASEGYDAEWDCVRAIDAGAPHVRDRVFIAANAKGNGWGPGRPWGLASGLAGLPVKPHWRGNPIDFFEERYAQPALLGVDDGLSRGLDRLNLCGNAVLPTITEMIGRSFLLQEA